MTASLIITIRFTFTTAPKSVRTGPHNPIRQIIAVGSDTNPNPTLSLWCLRPTNSTTPRTSHTGTPRFTAQSGATSRLNGALKSLGIIIYGLYSCAIARSAKM